MVVKAYTFVGKSANCDLTSNWATFKSVAGQRLYTFQHLRPVSAIAYRGIFIKKIVLLCIAAVHNFRTNFQCGRRTLSFKNQRVLFNFKESRLKKKKIQKNFCCNFLAHLWLFIML